MRTTTSTTTIVAPSRTGTDELTEEQRFALLAARTGLEPSLAERYTTDPVSVLAEFGLSATEPVYSGHGDQDAPGAGSLVIEDLSSVEGAMAAGCGGTVCDCTMPLPYPPLQH
ncbi:hypothetical protein [Streptomyces apocyni]|uniref:hypothetical protein n=1 Tax=Streptomyces apocyni TaxID=2654677 RepID=UPI0012EA3777|nr:hypothetical protein [Streptomyces apocyni]